MSWPWRWIIPYNGGGSFSPPGASFPAVANTLIEAAKFNAVINDIATNGLSNCITKDGQTTVTANIPLGGYKLTGVGAATARTDAATLASIQDGTGVYVATVGGTADVITLTPSPAIASYTAGQSFSFIASGANTTNVTVNVSGLGAKAVTKNGSTALAAGDIPSGALVEITYDGTRFQITSVAINAAAYLPITGGTLTGNLLFTDATYDIGASGATRPRDLYLSRNAVFGNNATATGALSGATVAGAMVADQSAMETATATDKLVSPGRQHFHPSAAKAWAGNNSATLQDAYNVSSITNNGTGDWTYNFTTSLSTSTYAVITSSNADRATPSTYTRATGSVRISWIRTIDSTAQTGIAGIVVFGDI